MKERGVLGPPGGLGLLLAGPTISTHGTPEQVQRYLPDIVCGRRAWCQLFFRAGGRLRPGRAPDPCRA